MARSNGYRPTKANREEVMALRARLGELRGDKWRTADAIMQEITQLLGHKVGPGKGRIKPRACGVCDYFGHTKQWCPRRLEMERRRAEREADKELRAHEAWRKTVSGRPVNEKWVEWLRWADRRWEAGGAAGGCVEEEFEACMVCKGCAAWSEAVRAFEAENPEPVWRTSQSGACT